MFINHDKKVIFLHNMKCGGNYVIDKLIKYYGFEKINNDLHKDYETFFDDKTHIKTDEDLDSHTIRKFGLYRYYYSHQNIDRSIFKDYSMFTFVRNPYDKIYSAYNYLKRLVTNSPTNKTRNSKENPEYFVNFNTFIKNMDNVNNISYCHAFIPQYEHFVNYSNEMKIQYIGKTETLDDDFVNVLKIIGFEEIKHINEIFYNKKLNVSVNNLDNISGEIDEYTLRFINERFKVDFEAFGYKKYENIEDLKESYLDSSGSITNKEQEECKDNQLNLNKMKTNMKLIEKLLDLQENCLIQYETFIGKNLMLSNNNIIASFNVEKLNRMNGGKSCVDEHLDIEMRNEEITFIHNEYSELLKKKQNIIDKTYLSLEEIVKNISIETNYECNNCKFICYNFHTKKIHSYFCKNNPGINNQCLKNHE